MKSIRLRIAPVFVAVIAVLAMGVATAQAQATIVGGGSYATIQAAINAAAPGSTINVAAGTYYEQLTITKELTLVGDILNPDDVVIDGANSLSLPSEGQVRIYNPSGPVVFKGFKIINGGTKSGLYVAILTKGAQPRTIEKCKIFGHGSSVGLGDDYGLWAYSGVGALTISGNYFSNMYHGILLEQQSGESTVANNTFDALVTGMYEGAKYGGRAVEAIVYGGLTVTSLQKIMGNQFINFASTGVQFSGGFAGQSPGKFTDVVIAENNFAFDMTTISNLNGAIYLVNVSGAQSVYSDPAGGVSATIQNNVITVPGGHGIKVRGLNGVISINFNSIAGNLLSGVKADQSLGQAIDATCNWWGDASGPSGVGPGSGDSVTANVVFTPWQISPGGPCSDCAAKASNHGQYVSCITDLANQLYQAGTITKTQRQQIITNAAKSKIGK